MRKILKNIPNTHAYLDSLPKIYLVGCWARYGVREFPFTGKYTTIEGYSVPLVYDYYDANGTRDEWHLMPITSTTTGWILLWTQAEGVAQKVARLYNDEMESRMEDTTERKREYETKFTKKD